MNHEMNPGNPNLQPEQPILPESTVEAVIAEQTRALQEASRFGGRGQQVARELGERAVAVAGIIRDNPERVSADLRKPPQHRTVHDPERAHLIALTAGRNMAVVEKYRDKIEAGKRLMPWQRRRFEKHSIGAHLGEDLANELYDRNPTAMPFEADFLRQIHIENGSKAHKLIKRQGRRPKY